MKNWYIVLFFRDLINRLEGSIPNPRKFSYKETKLKKDPEIKKTAVAWIFLVLAAIALGAFSCLSFIIILVVAIYKLFFNF
jgi:hypothetical protein